MEFCNARTKKSRLVAGVENKMEDEKYNAEHSRKALEMARHELTTLHGLIVADGAAPMETWRIDTNQIVAAIDKVLSEASAMDSSLS